MEIEVSEVVGLILHFRTPAHTVNCLRSLVTEGLRTAVLVDNSEDGGTSLSEMRGDLRRLSASGVCVEILAPARNLGFAKGVNTGLVRAMDYGAKAILLINSDAYFEKGAMARLLRAICHADVAIPRVLANDGVPTSGLFGFYQSATALIARKACVGCVRYASGCCLMMRKEVVKLPLFDEDFFFYGEDVELGHQLSDRGVRVVESQDAVIVHAGSGSARNGSMFYEYHINRGHWLLARKLASNRFQHGGYVVCRCFTMPARALVRSFRFRSLVPCRGLLTATIDVIRGRCRSFTPPAS